jgi:hypothetical protein
MTLSGSRKARCASTKLTPCLARLSASFFGSHSNSTGRTIAYILLFSNTFLHIPFALLTSRFAGMPAALVIAFPVAASARAEKPMLIGRSSTDRCTGWTARIGKVTPACYNLHGYRSIPIQRFHPVVVRLHDDKCACPNMRRKRVIKFPKARRAF